MKMQAKFILTPRHPNDVLEKYYSYLTFLFDRHDKLDEEACIEVNYRNYL